MHTREKLYFMNQSHIFNYFNVKDKFLLCLLLRGTVEQSNGLLRLIPISCLSDSWAES